MNTLILVSIAIPMIAGIILIISSFLQHIKMEKEVNENNRLLHIYSCVLLVCSVSVALFTVWSGEKELVLMNFVDQIPIYFHIDSVGRLFVTIVSIVWMVTGVYSFEYMKHEGDEKRYFGFFLLLYGVLLGLDFSGNLITMYLFYELVTITSFPLVLHNKSREAIMASLKYLFYSMCGAYAGLFGIFVLYRYDHTLQFTAGGLLTAEGIAGQGTFYLIAVFMMLLGFGAKAGMLPLHAWLPTAHPVAPSPASACLSGIIVKSGVLAIIRTVFYVVGPDLIRGTWVQYTWMILSLLTIFMGSLLAYREKTFKKRLAYSTVSQVSYVLFGLSLLSPVAFTGALIHTAAHALIKCGLFLTAGVFLYKFGFTKVNQLRGLGKKMPIVFWCYTFFALALIGIPPTSGFISKWYLAQGSLQTQAGFFSWLGPVILLTSALMTAGYLLPITMNGFFPGDDTNSQIPKKEPSLCMLFPLIVLACLVVGLGILPNGLIEYVNQIATAVF